MFHLQVRSMDLEGQTSVAITCSGLKLLLAPPLLANLSYLREPSDRVVVPENALKWFRLSGLNHLLKSRFNKFCFTKQILNSL